MERHAHSLTGRIAQDPAARRLLQATVCLGALIGAGALTLETRISAASVPPISLVQRTAPEPDARETRSTPEDEQAVEAKARATAQKALADALARATVAVQPASSTAAAGNAPSVSAAQAPALSDADLRLLADKAAQALKAGDIGGARMVLERAAAAGDATAVFALAETYDPNVLAKMHVRGLVGDVARAKELYTKASSEGVARAKSRLQQLAAADAASAD